MTETNRLFRDHHADTIDFLDRARLLPGRVVIQVEKDDPRRIIQLVKLGDEDETQIHRGVVLARGGPARRFGHEVEPGFEAGDTVLFVWSALEKQWTFDRGRVALLPQENIVAVLEGE